MGGRAPAGIIVKWDPGIPIEYRNQVVAGDCRELSKNLPSECIGNIITSPPYNVGLKYDGFNDNLPEDEFIEFNNQWLVEAYRISKDKARMYVVLSDKMLWWFKEIAEGAGWKYQQLLTWCKPNLVGGYRLASDWQLMSENILLFRKGKKTPMLKNMQFNAFNWMVINTPQTNYNYGRDHVAQWPLMLPYRLLSRTPGEPVIDLFAGSGEGLKAAKLLGKKFIGFELVEKTVILANKRLEATELPLFSKQLDLFVEGSEHELS